MGRHWIILVLAGWLGISCNPSAKNRENGKLSVLATTGMIGDAVKNIVRDSAEVVTLMGPGVDPHLYKATQGDLQKLQQADVIFYNGLHLEGKMVGIFEKVSNRKPVFAVADGVPPAKLIHSPQFRNAPDPHIWFDVSTWKDAVVFVKEQMKTVDSLNAAYYEANAAEYLRKLDSLHEFVKRKIAGIPEDQRVLITAHDAFGYFGAAYDIEVKGLQGISTMSDYGLKDITDLVDFIIKRNIKAVFVETSVSKRSIKAVIEGCLEKGHEVKIGGSLYSDAMGPTGTFEGTYIGMVTTNVKTIVESLK